MKANLITALAVLFAFHFSPSISAADDSATLVKQPVPEGVSPAIGKLLSAQPIEVKVKDKLVCHVWLRKEWPVKAESPRGTILYPFQTGELIGVVNYPKQAGDFRDQQIKAGTYTLRYGLQPEDGNHIGTSDTRDFFMLLPVKADAKPERIADMQTLFDHSSQAANSTHPAILSMLAVRGKSAKLPAVRHDEDRELYSIRAQGKGRAGKKVKDLTIEFVVVGHGDE